MLCHDLEASLLNWEAQKYQTRTGPNRAVWNLQSCIKITCSD